MCFSVEVEREIKHLLRKFMAQQSLKDEELYLALVQKGSDHEWAKSFLNLKRRPTQNPFRGPDDDGRIYPGTFTQVMVIEDGKRLFKPMRYRLRPRGSKEEIPSKFNVFNARLDSLEIRQTWKPLFMRQHGLFPFKRFYEWVEDGGKKRLISFAPDSSELMWAPCLWDQWVHPTSGESFYTFALLTDDPPAEVLALGHDRCPIFLSEGLIDQWLTPSLRTKSDMYDLLKTKEKVFYHHAWAA